MTKKLLFGGAVLALLLTALAMAGCGAESSNGTVNVNGQQQGIWVSGEGKVTATPDIATISAGVQAQATAVSDAQSQASTAMDKVIAALKSNGVAAKDIQTQNFNIQKASRWDNTTQQEIVTGYMVTNTVTAKIRDVNNAGVVIDAVTNAGGDLTRINSISFSIDNPAPYQEQARQKAVADAAAKAKTLAGAAGVKLGKPVYINESSVSSPVIYRDAAMAKAPSAGGTTTPISA
ncbi:MAG TPA: SIMPL domain-containing protein, partial [Dehalococcoidales bacterium]|nr:SIMPL domain-containing protein [Dehalococcoidales bacterium]